MAACDINAKEQVLKLRKGGEIRAPVSATSVLHLFFRFPCGVSIASNMPDHLFFVLQLRMA
jgi:hypothetical protein